MEERGKKKRKEKKKPTFLPRPVSLEHDEPTGGSEKRGEREKKEKSFYSSTLYPAHGIHRPMEENKKKGRKRRREKKRVLLLPFYVNYQSAQLADSKGEETRARQFCSNSCERKEEKGEREKRKKKKGAHSIPPFIPSSNHEAAPIPDAGKKGSEEEGKERKGKKEGKLSLLCSYFLSATGIRSNRRVQGRR